MRLWNWSNSVSRLSRRGFSTFETMWSMVFAAVAMGVTVNGYIAASARAERSAYSLAAHSLALQRLEQVRAAKWDPAAFPPVDEVVQTNFPIIACILDIPISRTNAVYATNFTTINAVSSNPPLKMIRVDCVWNFMNRGLLTNSIVTYRAPDQ